ncbi:tyrosine-type recombinase/integrase [Erythrobacter sp. SCSIO 43205]|uniref:tyrosine-type recombinase/integrase n=1 Tax=Erythrobacter sp. SCSIO 43205 TaxID=2779361 RepID=UPI001CA7E5E4|nr:tyrosine-type recombinase/integrase [Erythrobacter sp. SCSIO 43205]UAB77922.1 tyrosine-type recombinase/integrase [Erythrobacter sp. SCSIO 43205]
MTDLSRIGEREKLKPRSDKEPHWHRLQAGWYIGYRPSIKGGKGTWFARAYDEDARKYRRKKLGSYGTLSGNSLFATAKRDAEAFAEVVEAGGLRIEKLETVKDACLAYLQEKPGPIAEGIFRRHVFDDPISKVKLDKVRKRHLLAWRKRLENAPARISRNKSGEQRYKTRAASTVNRDMVPLRAALWRVISPGAPNTDAAWQEALKPIKGADRRREIYLDRSERKKLLSALPRDIEPFVRGLCLLPLRPGALAALKVSNFDKRTRTLTIGADKNGMPRQISVPETIAGFLADQCKSKLSAASVFTRADGVPWSKDKWKGPIKGAVKAAGLPQAASAYTIRHSVITDLVRAGLPILTVAQLSDTSVAMIEKHYGHLVRSDAEHALAQLAL